MTYEEYLDEIATLLTEIYTLDDDVAIGIAMMLLGTGLAFYFGKPFIQPSAPMLPSIPLGAWSALPQVRSALDINALFFVGVAVAAMTSVAFFSDRIERALTQQASQLLAADLVLNGDMPASEAFRAEARRRGARALL